MKRPTLFPLRLAAAFLAAALTFSLTACGSGQNSFTWFVEEIPANLDPQVAYAPADVIACENLYSGLVRKNTDGQLQAALAESWTVSPDGLTYTFTLRDGLTYQGVKGAATGYAITAEDFVFAFRRIFRSATASPYAVEFSALQNSAAVLSGLMPESALGVEAVSPLVLVFHLSEADDAFLEKLTLPGAMPCDEEFFTGTRGTYGLKASTVLSSGSFYLYNWTSGGLFLRRTPSGNRIDNLRLVQNTTAVGQTATELIANEKCSAALDETGVPTSLQSVAYSDTVWCLLFNCQTVFSSSSLRLALASTARTVAQTPDALLYIPATGLVPNGITTDGLDYRTSAGDPFPTVADPLALYREARQGITNSDFNHVTLLLPSGSGLTQTAERINSVWQKDFSLFFSLEEVDPQDFEARLASGDYTIAIAPISASSGSVDTILASGSTLTGYDDPLFASQLEASASVRGSARCALLSACEQQLLGEGVITPLFAQQKRLLLADGIQGLIFDPFGPVLDLTETTRS